MHNNKNMNGSLWDYVAVITPGGAYFGVIALSEIKDLSAIAVAIVTIVCTVLVTIQKLSRRRRFVPPPPDNLRLNSRKQSTRR